MLTVQWPGQSELRSHAIFLPFSPSVACMWCRHECVFMCARTCECGCMSMWRRSAVSAEHPLLLIFILLKQTPRFPLIPYPPAQMPGLQPHTSMPSSFRVCRDRNSGSHARISVNLLPCVCFSSFDLTWHPTVAHQRQAIQLCRF